jgi:hypothetical protein
MLTGEPYNLPGLTLEKVFLLQSKEMKSKQKITGSLTDLSKQKSEWLWGNWNNQEPGNGALERREMHFRGFDEVMCEQ